MNILISGGSGLIGSALTKELAKDRHRVSILSRSPEKVRDVPQNVQVLGWDGKTAAGWGNIIGEIDAVINLAGSPLNGNGPLDMWLTRKRKKELLESRLNASHALIEGIRITENKPKIFIQASAVGYYGPLGNEIVDESQPAGEDTLAQVQYQSEKSTQVLDEMGIRRVIIRTGLVLAKNADALSYFKLQFSLFAGGRIGSGEQYYSWIHINDEVKAIKFLIENKAAVGPFNLVSPNPVMNKEFAKTLGKVMKRPSFFVIPAFLMRLVLGEVSTVVLDGQRLSPKKLESLGFTFQYPELLEALEDVI